MNITRANQGCRDKVCQATVTEVIQSERNPARMSSREGGRYASPLTRTPVAPAEARSESSSLSLQRILQFAVVSYL